MWSHTYYYITLSKNVNAERNIPIVYVENVLDFLFQLMNNGSENRSVALIQLLVTTYKCFINAFSLLFGLALCVFSLYSTFNNTYRSFMHSTHNWFYRFLYLTSSLILYLGKTDI